MEPMTSDKKTARPSSSVSLHPLTLDEAMADLLKVKPSPKGKEAKRKKPKKK